MVAQGRRLEVHRVEESDVAASIAGHTQNGVVGAVSGREEAGAGYVVVAGAEDQGVGGVLTSKAVQHG